MAEDVNFIGLKSYHIGIKVCPGGRSVPPSKKKKKVELVAGKLAEWPESHLSERKINLSGEYVKQTVREEEQLRVDYLQSPGTCPVSL